MNTNTHNNSLLLEDDFFFLNGEVDATTKLRYILIRETHMVPECSGLAIDLDLPVNGYDQAMKIAELSTLGQLPVPDAVLVDIPYDRSELVSFVVSIKSLSRFSSIPIVYNSKYLSASQASTLFEKELIDDVMAMDDNMDHIHAKVSLLKKVKNHPPTPHLEKEETLVEDFGLTYPKEFLKRMVDIIASSCLLIVAFPILLLIAIAIKLDSGGSVFYSSPRAGKRYKVFKLFKFRTMIADADRLIDTLGHLNQYDDGGDVGHVKFLKIINDPRITKVGKFLRKTSLDELPQLFNVLKGDMSLVGNRPLPLYEASTLTTNAHVPRFMAPAGITGLWQITKRGHQQMSVKDRINLDILYAKRRSLVLDFKILLLTPFALFQDADV
jgi:lipopolysaccharide/colanic/teichoic acid biosynthesis glycosyltransferase